MPCLLARSLELGFGARGWREPGMERDSIDLFELLKPELVLVALLAGGSALLVFALGVAAGCAWRVFINRKTSWWWILGVSALLAVGGVAVAIVLLLRNWLY
jgi:hypothetical protein